ncbi:MAG: YihY/virulence factor BrkB family protein [Clostridia bacterium]|nr:YihY/virulence factor BrkB family protein [Clostridia bacterium]
MKKQPIIVRAVKSFLDDDVPSMAAQLAFYINTAFFPFVIFLFIIISSTPILDESALYDLIAFLPNQTSTIVLDGLRQVTASKSLAIITGGVSMWSMSNAVATVSRALNKFYDVKENRNILYIRLLGIIFALLILVTIILNFVLLVGGTLIGTVMIKYLPQYYALWHILRFIVPFVLMIVLFASMYKVMPCVDISFKHSLCGAFFTACSWIVFSSVFSYYVNNFSSYDIIYGSIAGIVVLFTWIFVTAYIILIGGEINSFLAGHFSRRKREF